MNKIRFDISKAKATCRAIQNRMEELGLDFKLGHAYEAYAVANGHPNWATMKAVAGEGSDVSDGNLRDQDLYLGHRFGKQYWIPRRTFLGHFHCFSARDAARTHFLSSMQAKAVLAGRASVMLCPVASDGDAEDAVERLTSSVVRHAPSSRFYVIDLRGSGRPVGNTFSLLTETFPAEQMAEALLYADDRNTRRMIEEFGRIDAVGSVARALSELHGPAIELHGRFIRDLDELSRAHGASGASTGIYDCARRGMRVLKDFLAPTPSFPGLKKAMEEEAAILVLMPRDGSHDLPVKVFLSGLKNAVALARPAPTSGVPRMILSNGIGEHWLDDELVPNAAASQVCVVFASDSPTAPPAISGTCLRIAGERDDETQPGQTHWAYHLLGYPEAMTVYLNPKAGQP